MSLAQNPLTGQMRQSMANFVTTVYRGQNVIRAKVFMPKDVIIVKASLGVKPSLRTKEDSLQVERLAGDCWLRTIL